MRFIDPKTDFAFKKIFGSAGHEGVLRSFLNAFLYQGREEITELTLQDPYNIPRLKGLKDSYLDVRLRQSDGKWILVEMQVVNVPGFEKRILFNAAKQFSTQVVQGQDYDTLDPVVLLTITDFVMFKEWPTVQSRYRLFETEQLVEYPVEGMELVFVELPKFTKTHAEATQLWEKWVCFLKEAGSLKRMPSNLVQVPQIKEAFEIANYAGLTPEEAQILDNKTLWWHDQKKMHTLYDEAQAKLKQAETKSKQAEAECDEAKAKYTRTLRQAVLSLRQSGMQDARVCHILGISSQQLHEILRTKPTVQTDAQ
ncbi:MAG: Rpn family recombination-promoting nuclease/putative transposase [Myxococcota bacterium]